VVSDGAYSVFVLIILSVYFSSSVLGSVDGNAAYQDQHQGHNYDDDDDDDDGDDDDDTDREGL